MDGRTLCPVYLTGKEQLPEELDKLIAKAQPDWPSFNPKSQHDQEADNAVFLYLHNLQILGHATEKEVHKLWMADCFIVGCAYASASPQGSDPFFVVGKVAQTLHVLPLRRLVPDSIFCFYPSVNPY